MRGLSQLRRGRGLLKRARRAWLRRAQPRYAGKKLRSQFKAAPRQPRPGTPFLGADANLADLL